MAEAGKSGAEYYSLNGRPLRRRHRLATLEILTPSGVWEHWSDPKRLWSEAEVIKTEAQFEALCRDYLGLNNRIYDQVAAHLRANQGLGQRKPQTPDEESLSRAD